MHSKKKGNKKNQELKKTQILNTMGFVFGLQIGEVVIITPTPIPKKMLIHLVPSILQ